jgi:uncharacterized membrane protein YfcA
MSGFLAEFPALLGDWRIYAALACTAVAGIMRGYSGFGTAVLLAPLYSVLWGPRIGVPVVEERRAATAEAAADAAAGVGPVPDIGPEQEPDEEDDDA